MALNTDIGIIDGFGQVTNIIYVNENKEGRECSLNMQGQSGLIAPSLIGCITKKNPTFYLVKSVNLSSSINSWGIYGTSTVARININLSTQTGTPELLKQSILKTVSVNNEGNFNFEIMENLPETIYIWFPLPFSFEAISSHSIEVKAIPMIIDTSTIIKYALFSTYNENTCQACLGTGEILYNPDFPMVSYGLDEAPEFTEEMKGYEHIYITGSKITDKLGPFRVFCTNDEVIYNGENYEFQEEQLYYTPSLEDSTATWIKSTSGVKTFSYVQGTKTDIYNNEKKIIRQADKFDFPLAAICEHCSGNGIEQAYSGETFQCRSCEGDGGMRVGVCPTCEGTGINSSYWNYPRCNLTGTWPGPNYSSTLYISYWPEDQPEIIFNSSEHILLLNENIAYSYKPESTNFNFYITKKELGDYGDYILKPRQRWVLWTGLTEDSYTNIQLNSVMVEGGEESTDNWICLSGDTLITTPNGFKRMDELSPGDEVISSQGIAKVNHIYGPGFSEEYNLYYFENDIIIKETAPHRFFNVEQNLYQNLSQWNIGEHGLNINNKPIKLLKKEHYNEPAEKYSLFTSDGDYYANGLLTGSIICNKKMLAEADKEQLTNIFLTFDDKICMQLLNLNGGLLP